MQDTESTNQTFGKNSRVLILVFFLLLIFIPGFNMLTSVIPEAQTQENRALAVWPEFSLWRVMGSGWQREVDNYLNDHFGFRSYLVKQNAKINLGWFGISPSVHVVVGKDGWLFYAAEYAIEDYMAVKPFTEDQVNLIVEELERRRRILEEQGIKFVVMFAPDKHSIYPEFLPNTIYKVGLQNRLDQITRALAQNTSVRFVDPREKFLDAKKEHLLYLKTDTHWNRWGAFLAYQELMNTISEMYPNLHQAGLEDLRVSDAYTCKAGDLSAMLFLRDEMEDTCMDLSYRARIAYAETDVDFISPRQGRISFATEQEDGYPADVLVQYDSFFNTMRPHFSANFKRVAYVWDYDFHEYILEKEQPDLVVLEIVERHLFELLPKEIREY